MTAEPNEQRARRMLDEGRYEEAKQQIQLLLREQFDQPGVWLLEAELRMGQEEWEAAENAIFQARQLAPADHKPHLLWAQFCRAVGQFEDGLEALKEAAMLDLSPEDKIDVHLDYARTFLAWLEDQKEQNAIEENDWRDQTDYAEMFEDEFVEATRQVKKAIALAPENVTALLLKARLAEQQDRPTEAIVSWERAYELSPDVPEIIHGLARTYEVLEYEEEAHELYNKLHTNESAKYADLDTHPLQFEAPLFAAAAQKAWAELKAEWALDDQPFDFQFQTQIYPSSELMQESSPQSLFDPRVGLHVAFASPFLDEPVVQLVMFQRNIERDLEGDDPESLHFAIHDLLETCIERIFDVLEDDDDDDW